MRAVVGRRANERVNDSREFRQAVLERLMGERAGPCWEGRLSSSAVAAAVAVFALSVADRSGHRERIRRGLDWIVLARNPDGGWGDSPESPSNLTATVLVWSALSLSRNDFPAHVSAAESARRWLIGHCGGDDAQAVRRAVLRRYGDDRTFAAPILTMCALSGRLGRESEAWDAVPQLPFELAVLPNWLFKAVRLTVVSYALPALIAIGLARHRRAPSANPALRALRNALARRVVRIAGRMQPSNGGYEEATPLTAFVVMSLASAGLNENEVVRRGVRFLCQSQRDDGGWPIDTNLATWLTSLSLCAIGKEGVETLLTPFDRRAILQWLLGQQYTLQHPLTFGAAGGWSWTDLPGGMPDADDTSGALLAIHALAPDEPAVLDAAHRGVRWLLDLQNSDGGMPTFSRGWGKLPFDRSCPDITAHAMQAFVAWEPLLAGPVAAEVRAAFGRMTAYLARSQDAAGAWKPLWFGNQHVAGEGNRTYGTARVLLAIETLGGEAEPRIAAMLERGRRWLTESQNADGGWSGDRACSASVEETALAVSALARYPGAADAVARGIRWLDERTRGGTEFHAAPIGLYFASLWYSERLYPVIFTAWALSRAGGRGGC